MKKILKYITGAALLSGLAGCANDDFMQGPVASMPEDGRLTIRYTVPDMQTVATRAVKQDDIDNMTLLIFNSAGVLRQVEDVTDDLKPGSATGSFTVTVDENLRRDGALKFRMVANVGSSKYTKSYFEGLKGTTPALVSQTVTALSFAPVNTGGTDTYIGMSGELTLNEVLGYNTMAMVRNIAKVSANMAVLDASNNPVVENNKLKKGDPLPFANYGSASQSSIFAGLHKAGNNMLSNGPTSVTVANSHVTNMAPVYIHPTKNASTGRAFVIVKANYPAVGEEGSQPYFYRLDYQKKTGSEIKTLDLEPNHEYEFIITGVIGKGYATAAEAAKNPTPIDGGNISWDIYDHAPNVMNMVTDGTNYLGTSKEVNAAGNVTGNNVKSEYFYVHVANKNDEYPNPVLKAADFSCSTSWMRIGDITPASDDEIGTAIDSENDIDGKLYKVELQITAYSTPGSQEGNITVNWNGLTREVPVHWNRNFDPDDLLKSVRLQVYKDGTTQEQSSWQQSDYFGFLNGNEDTGATPNVWGVDADSNNGHARNEGFHFPLMYGDNTSNPWTYKYTVVFNNQTDGNYKWKFSVPTVEDGNSSVIANNLKIAVTGDSDNNGEVTSKATDTNGPTITLTFDSKAAGWEYGVGQLMVEVAPENTEDWVPIPLEVYHTGFFHKDDYTHAAEGSYDSSRGYTYYEVAQVAGQYWLDRNLGAHSAELYIESASGRAHLGTTEGRGAYYYVALQVDKAPSFYTGICPPGYQIPYSSDWDNVRRSSSFINVNMGNYITAYYQTTARNEDGTAKQVFFSKSRYMDASTKTGDSLAGYYWSRTTATGFEKDEIGRWLRGFVLLGESTYHNNSRIDFGSGKTGFALSLRCVNTHTEAAGTEHVSFFVKGATHVFAYKQNPDNTRVTVTSWPGVAVGNYNTADAGYLNFDYVGGIAPEDLLLIFNFKDRNGQVTSISRSGDGSVARITTNVSPNDLVGWAARGDVAPNGGVTVDGGLITSASTGINTSTTKYYWNISRETATDNFITNAEVASEPIVQDEFRYVLRGNCFTGSWSSVPMTENAGIWSATDVNVSGGELGIRVLDKNETDINTDNKQKKWYAHDGNGTVTLSTAMAVKEDGTKWNLAAGKYSFEFNPTAMTLKITGSVTPATYTYRVRGNIFTNSWDGNGTTKDLTRVGTSNIYEATVTVSYDGEFGIQEMNGSSEVGFYKGGGDVTLNTPINMTTGSGNSKIKKGTYKFSFDADNKKLTVTKNAQIYDIWLLGEFNSWQMKDSNYKFSSTDGVTYTLTVTGMDTNNFKINGGDWNTRNLGTGNTGMVDNTSYTLYNNGDDMQLSTGGNVTFTVTTTDEFAADGNTKIVVKHN